MPNNEYANAGDQSRAERILSATINNTEYDEPVQSRLEYLLKQLKDLIATLRQAVVLRGETTTPITDNATTNPIMIDGQSYTAIMNDAVIYQSGEFIFDGTKWHALGDLSNLTAANIGAMTGYSKPNETSAIAIADTLNQAIGKLEKALDLKQSALTEPQLAAVNSGITSTDVTQIGTNKNNISLVEQANGKKNLFNLESWKNVPCTRSTLTVSGTEITLTNTDSDGYTNYTTADGYPQDCIINVSAGDKIVATWDTVGTPPSGSVELLGNGLTTAGYRFFTQYSSKYLECTVPNDVTFLTMRLRNFTGVGTLATIKNLMICKKSMYDAGFTDYMPYALSNAELTEKTVGMSEGGSNYITVGGIRVYVSATAPTGARTGDLWIGG